MKLYVYCITCLVNGKPYVGKTNNPERCWRDHCELEVTRGRGMLIHRAIGKHGPENFRFEVIAERESEDEAFEAEHEPIVEWKTTDLSKGYSLNEGGRDGRSPSEFVRQKISAKHRGKKISDAQKAMISARHKGKVMSEETCRKMSQSCTCSGNHRLGKTWSEETRQRTAETKARRKAAKAIEEAHP